MSNKCRKTYQNLEDPAPKSSLTLLISRYARGFRANGSPGLCQSGFRDKLINKQKSENPTITNITKSTHIELWNLYKIQNKHLFYWCFSMFPTFSKKSNVFSHVWSILYNKLIFWISDSDSVGGLGGLTFRDASATLYPSEGCFSDVRGPFRTPNPKQSQNKWSVRKLFTLLRHFLNIFEEMFKNTLKLCSHIELNTPNPNTIFKITTYCKK